MGETVGSEQLKLVWPPVDKAGILAGQVENSREDKPLSPGMGLPAERRTKFGPTLGISRCDARDVLGVLFFFLPWRQLCTHSTAEDTVDIIIESRLAACKIQSQVRCDCHLLEENKSTFICEVTFTKKET